ncbi:MAG: TonB family protein [Dysgonamonadaceae bacterium]|jgi:protein TonB|nr:TonB family protein [Dysgonamonadaceae bacterium]
MAQGFDLTSDKWLALVFEKRNKQYGAYALRNQSSNRHLTAILIVTLVSLLAIFLPRIISAVVPDKVEDLSRDEEFKMTEVVTTEIPEENEVKALEVPPPPELKATIQFNPPKVVEDEKVTDDNQMLSQQDLLDSQADISVATIAGSDKGTDIADLIDNKVVVQEPPKEQIFHHVEKMPEFPGGPQALLKWLRDHLKYPPDAEEQGIQGTVSLRFVVDENGNVGELTVVKGLSKSCDEEAVRQVKKLPKFIPGEQNGKKVKVYYSLPVKFKIQSRD